MKIAKVREAREEGRGSGEAARRGQVRRGGEGVLGGQGEGGRIAGVEDEGELGSQVRGGCF